MKIFLQRKLSWLDLVPSDVMKKCNQLNLVSKEGQATSIPVQLLTASSPFLNSLQLTMPSFSCQSITASISIPSATSSTLQLLAQILSMGETDESGGLETTITNMNELQSIFTLLEMNVKLCPKLSPSKPAIEAVDYGVVAAVRDEVLTVEETKFKEIEVQNHVGLIIKKKSTIKKHSLSGKFRHAPLLKKKENMVRNLSGDKKYVKNSCEEFDPCCKVEQRCDNVRFKQSGLLQDFKVSLVESSSDGTHKEDAMCKTNASKGEKSLLMCNLCGVEVNKHVGLRRHYHVKHGIQEERSTSKGKGTARKVQLQEVHKRKKESEECTKVEVLSKEILSKRKECNECDASFNNNHSLRKHKWRVHESQIYEPIGCGECDLSFKYKSSLRRHRMSVHEGKTYGCGVCDKITAYRDGMMRHCNKSGHDKELIYVIADLP